MANDATVRIGGDIKPLEQSVNSAESLFGQFGNELEAVMERVADTIAQSVSDSISDAMANMTEQLTATISDAMEDVREEVEDAGEVIQDLASKSGGGFSRAFETVTSVLSGTVGKLALAAAGVGAFIAVVLVAKNKVGDAFAAIRDGIVGAFSAMKDRAVEIFDNLVGAVKSAASMVASAFNTIAAPIKATFEKVAGVITAVFQSVIDRVTAVVRSFTQQVPLAFADLQSGLSEGFRGLAQQETAWTRVNALVRATGNVAGFTAEELNKMAQAMQQVTVHGDDVVLSAQAILLQFKNIRGDIFKGALEAAADMAAATGGDLASAADRLGRSLDNPIRAMRQLRSEGILFSAAEQQLIEDMVMSGRIMQAQQMILDKVAGSFKGAAAAMANTFTGKMQQLNNILGDAWEELANALIPAFEEFIPLLKESAERTMEFAKQLRGMIENAVAWVKDSMPVIESWFEEIMRGAQEAFKWVADRALELFAVIQTVFQDPEAAWTAFSDAAAVAFQQVKIFFLEIWDTVFKELLSGWEITLAKMGETLAGLQAKFVAFFTYIEARQQGMDKATASAMAKAAAAAVKASAAGEVEAAKERAKDRREGRGPRDPEEDSRMAAERARLEALRKKAQESGGIFGANFDANLEKNRKNIDAFFDAMLKDLGLKPEDMKSGAGGSNAPFVFEKEDESAGAFEDLMALNKRIQSAAFKSPETSAIMAQTATIKMQHSQTIAMSQKQVDATTGVGTAVADVKRAVETPRPGVYA